MISKMSQGHLYNWSMIEVHIYAGHPKSLCFLYIIIIEEVMSSKKESGNWHRRVRVSAHRRQHRVIFYEGIHPLKHKIGKFWTSEQLY